ncbi:MAG: hypothetical protein AAF742_09515 [Pseudomonadota bacterium]
MLIKGNSAGISPLKQNSKTLALVAAGALLGACFALAPTPSTASALSITTSSTSVALATAGRGYYGRGFRGRRFYGNRFYGRRFYGGRFYRGGFYGRRFYRGGFYRPIGFRGGFYGPRYRRGLSGAEVFGITAGVVGGAILLDRALDNRSRAVVDREVVYLPQYPADANLWNNAPRDLDPNYRRPGDDFESGVRFERGRNLDREATTLEDERRRLEAERRDFEQERARFEQERERYLQERDFRNPSDDPQIFDDLEEEELRRSPINPVPQTEDRGFNGESLDDQLLGAPGAQARSLAFNECASEIRRTAGEEGLILALPAAPTEQPVDIGDGVVRMTAAFTAEGQDGFAYRRLMVCDVDSIGVKRLEVV